MDPNFETVISFLNIIYLSHVEGDRESLNQNLFARWCGRELFWGRPVCCHTLQ